MDGSGDFMAKYFFWVCWLFYFIPPFEGHDDTHGARGYMVCQRCGRARRSIE